EDELTTAVGTRVISKLRSLGHTVLSCTPRSASSVTNSLWQRCNVANLNRVDVFVSIHFNSFNGVVNGTEVFAASAAGEKLAAPVLREIVALGFNNRGVKNGAHLYVIRNTSSPAILVECCFCDSRRDMDLFDPEKMATAIVKGLTGQVPKPEAAPPPAQSSAQVLELQRTLNRLKILDRNNQRLAEDGFAGPATTSATQRLQAILGLVTDGIAGDRTWVNIRQILAKPVLRPNQSSGPAVRYVQYRVGVAIDGIYGGGTLDAVKRFQTQNRLTVDGIIGPQVWAALIG
ncbi:MAG TPA: N-acetylmuramoyl-L-alanine amidase, partial [Coleofasciculaceae cyanobacterium]